MTPRDSKTHLARLAGFPLFADMPEGALEALAEHVHPRSWAPGTVLFQRGDPGDYLVAITTGRVRISLANPHGREVVLRQAEAGEVLGEIAIIDGSPRSADAVAVADTSGLILLRDHFLAVARHMPGIYEALARYCCQLLRNTNFQMESIALYDLQARLARFLLFTLGQRFGDDPPAIAPLALGLNQSDLSAILGASRPKVNQAMQALLAGGAVVRKGDDLLCNVAELRNLSDPG